MNRLVTKSILSAAALTVSLGTIATAKAGPVDETVVRGQAVRTETVNFNRAELATAEGRESVERRIDQAAKSVCGPLSYSRVGNLGQLAKNRDCYHQAVAQGMSQLGADQLASTAK